jgi:hypothetical protein
MCHESDLSGRDKEQEDTGPEGHTPDPSKEKTWLNILDKNTVARGCSIILLKILPMEFHLGVWSP